MSQIRKIIYGTSLCTTPRDWIETLKIKIDKEKIVQDFLEISKEELQKITKKDDDFIEFEFFEIFDEELAYEHLVSFLNTKDLTLHYESEENSEYETLYFIGKSVETKEKCTLIEQENIKKFCKDNNLQEPEFIKLY